MPWLAAPCQTQEVVETTLVEGRDDPTFHSWGTPSRRPELALSTRKAIRNCLKILATPQHGSNKEASSDSGTCRHQTNPNTLQPTCPQSMVCIVTASFWVTAKLTKEALQSSIGLPSCPWVLESFSASLKFNVVSTGLESISPSPELSTDSTTSSWPESRINAL